MLTKQQRQLIVKLHAKKHREDQRLFFVEGIKGVEEAVVHADVTHVVIESARQDEDSIKDLIALSRKNNIQIHFASAQDVQNIKQTDTFPGVLAVVNMPDWKMEDVGTKVICIDGLNDPGNLGTIIRTADWFGVDTVLLSQGSVSPYNPKVVRATMGSFFRSKVIVSSQLIEDLGLLKSAGYGLFGFTLSGKSMERAEGKMGKSVYVFGSESHGISPEIERMCDSLYSIERHGEAESLNIAVAVGVVLHEMTT